MSLIESWDVLVVGTGMGGGTLGHALAKAGKKVLFCEKGRNPFDGDPGALLGRYAETFKDRPGVLTPSDREILKGAGRYSTALHDVSGHKPRDFVPFIGSGSGGSSALYGAALERFFPADFTPAANYPAGLGADLPDAWPVSFDEMRPCYQQAELLYRVRGGPDPLKGEGGPAYASLGAKLQPDNQELWDLFESKGLHPYRLPLACEQIPGCSGCQGYLCSRNCKNDSAKVCLAEAVAEYGAVVWNDCEVLSLEAGQSRVHRARCVRDGVPMEVEADIFVLAAGALETPAILLRSADERWPEGLANGSGLVGKYLMRHYVDIYAIFAESSAQGGGLKQIAFNDFYQTDEGKLGTVQSFGFLPPGDVIVDSLQDDLRNGPFPPLGDALGLVRPLMSGFLGQLFGRATMMATIMEDLPYRSNRVFLGERGELCIDYRIHPSEMERIRRFRKKLAKTLRPKRHMLVKQAENNQRIAHACGTCRFGNDPRSSVLDENNRAHQLDNLYVIDSSFFPSSGGTNPALTIGANALRVAEHILRRCIE